MNLYIQQIYIYNMYVSVNDIAENTLAEWVYLQFFFLKGIHPDYFSNPERCFLQDTRNISRSTRTLILCCVRIWLVCRLERWINEGMNWRSNKLQLSHNRKRTKQLTITAPSEHIALILRLLSLRQSYFYVFFFLL